MTYAAFRFGSKDHRARPAARERAARYAWDVLSARGTAPLQSMKLIDGLWMALRADDTFDDVSADFVRQRTKAQEMDYGKIEVSQTG